MDKRCRTAAVLGAGVMGAGIAAHLAGVGIDVLLLDRVPEPGMAGGDAGPGDRNHFARQGIERALKQKPPAFFEPEVARRITPGNFDDDWHRLNQCDLVIEVVVERLDVKRALLTKLADVVRPDVVLASNTSGLSIASMAEALPPDLRPRFVVMHFFNPPRFMRLLEVVAGSHTAPEVVAWVAALGQELGKGVVFGKDTPNFVANRIGVFAMMQAIHAMDRFGLGIEEVDRIAGKPMARAASAAFRTGDLVGIDTLLHVAHSCDALASDSQRDTFVVPAWVRGLAERGQTGQKAGAGFYKKEGGGILVFDVKSGNYRAQNVAEYASLAAAQDIKDPKERLRTLLAGDDVAARFAWHCVAGTLTYAAARLGEIADDVLNIDRAMRWGFNWELGPFEAWDAIGVEAGLTRMRADGLEVPAFVTDMLAAGQKSFYDGPPEAPCQWAPQLGRSVVIASPPQHIDLAVIAVRPKDRVAANASASVLDIGDGVLALCVHTIMNTIDLGVLDMLEAALDRAESSFDALVLGNDGEHFGAGFDLSLIMHAAQNKAWGDIDAIAKRLQNVGQRLRYSPVPVVAAPFAYTFGGCAELAMAADAMQAHAELYMGLVEVGVGIVPAGGGCLRLLQRYMMPAAGLDGVDPLALVGPASLQIAQAKTSQSAAEARTLRFLQPHDGISYSRERLLFDAKQRALALHRVGYRPPLPRLMRVAGLDAENTLGMRIWSMVESQQASAHDALIARHIAHILCGGTAMAGQLVEEQTILDLEREALLSLCGEEKSQARMQSMLRHNKPLRN